MSIDHWFTLTVIESRKFKSSETDASALLSRSRITIFHLPNASQNAAFP